MVTRIVAMLTGSRIGRWVALALLACLLAWIGAKSLTRAGQRAEQAKQAASRIKSRICLLVSAVLMLLAGCQTTPTDWCAENSAIRPASMAGLSDIDVGRIGRHNLRGELECEWQP